MGKRWKDPWGTVRLVFHIAPVVGLVGLGAAVVGLMIGNDTTVTVGFALFSVGFILAQAEARANLRQ